MNMDQGKGQISASGGHDGVSVIASHMNYGLYRADQMQECPQDAFNICRLLGLDERSWICWKINKRMESQISIFLTETWKKHCMNYSAFSNL